MDNVAMAITATDLDYFDGNDRLVGVLLRDESVTEKRPAVIIFHEAWGINDYILRRARIGSFQLGII